MPAARSRARASRSALPRVRPGSVDVGKAGRLLLGDQRPGQLAQRLAREHLLELVEGQVDAVVGDPVLRKL